MTATQRTAVQRDQFYVFTMPEDTMCPVWVEVYLADGSHHVAPSPFLRVPSAIEFLDGKHPGATVDELCEAADIEQCREWARTMPLEQIGA